MTEKLTNIENANEIDQELEPYDKDLFQELSDNA